MEEIIEISTQLCKECNRIMIPTNTPILWGNGSSIPIECPECKSKGFGVISY